MSSYSPCSSISARSAALDRFFAERTRHIPPDPEAAPAIARLAADRAPIGATRARLLELPTERFVQPHGLLKRILDEALA